MQQQQQSLRQAVLRQLAYLASREGGGHTCYPVHLLVDEVSRCCSAPTTKAGGQQSAAIAARILGEIHAMRKDGLVATTSRPYLMVARTDILECDRFVAYAFEFGAAADTPPPFSRGRRHACSSIADIAHSITQRHAKRPGGAAADVDAFHHALLTVFMDAKPVAACTPFGVGADLFIQSVAAICEHAGLPFVVLWVDTDPLAGMMPAASAPRSFQVDSGQDSMLFNLVDGGTDGPAAHAPLPLTVIVADAHNVGSRSLVSGLVRLRSDIRLVLVGDPAALHSPGVFHDIVTSRRVNEVWPNMGFSLAHPGLASQLLECREQDISAIVSLNGQGLQLFLTEAECVASVRGFCASQAPASTVAAAAVGMSPAAAQELLLIAAATAVSSSPPVRKRVTARSKQQQQQQQRLPTPPAATATATATATAATVCVVVGDFTGEEATSPAGLGKARELLLTLAAVGAQYPSASDVRITCVARSFIQICLAASHMRQRMHAAAAAHPCCLSGGAELSTADQWSSDPMEGLMAATPRAGGRYSCLKKLLHAGGA